MCWRGEQAPTGASWPILRRVAAGGFITFIALLANRTHLPLLFPELAALSYGVMTNPHGAWARAPGRLWLTPVLTALAGTIIARYVGFGVVPASLSVLASLCCLAWLRSPIIPAISAGLLPVVLGVRSYAYPLAVGLALLLLIMASIGLTYIAPRRGHVRPVPAPAPPKRPRARLVAYLLFIVALAAAASVPGWRLVLCPPLAVIAFDRMVMGMDHLWRRRLPVLFLISVLNTAAAALLFTIWGDAPLAIGASVGIGIMLLGVFKSHVAPVLAIGLLPFITRQGSAREVIAIAVGMAALSAVALVMGRIETNRFGLARRAAQSGLAKTSKPACE